MKEVYDKITVLIVEYIKYGDSDCRLVQWQIFSSDYLGIVIIVAVDLFHAFNNWFIEQKNELLKSFGGRSIWM